MERNWQRDLEVCRQATSGPWRAEVYARRVMPYICEHVDPVDARFIAEAREGWPAALEERERLEERVKELEEENARLQKEIAGLKEYVRELQEEIQDFIDRG